LSIPHLGEVLKKLLKMPRTGFLRFSADPTVIATSREPLRVEGEQVYRVLKDRVRPMTR
jgi:hypothetical protein